LVDVHDFPSDAVGKAIPYGVYDIGANDGFVSVCADHDTPVFAVTSIEAWWKQVGEKRYPDAREVYITADAGGSNSYRSHVWKQQLQRLADKLGLAIHVSHFPPVTSKWNKVEHRLFSFISINWRGRPLRTYGTIIDLIGNTTNRGGLVVRALLGCRNYPTGKKVSAKELRELKIERDEFHGDWNYVIRSRKQMP
jgi:Rhodopirellula transposase DDE domain